MKKFIVFILGFILILSVTLFGLLFTSPGNAIIKPFVESKIAAETKKTVTLDTFALRMGNINLAATIDKTSFVKLNGTYSLFNKSFDLTFDTSLQNITFDSITITSKMNLKGTAKGDITDLQVIANGEALQGTIAINANLLNKTSLKNSVVTLNHIELKELLLLLAQPPYAQGVFDLKADLKNVTQTAVDGAVDFKLLPTTLNSEAISKVFAINLPKNTTAQVDMNALLEGQTITSTLTILTTLATLKTHKTLFNVASQSLSSDYRFDIPDFEKLETLSKIKLKGEASFDGLVHYSPKGYDITLNSGILGSDTKVHVINDSLIASIANLKLASLMSFLNQSSYTQGELSLEAKLDSIKELKGTLTERIENGNVNTALVNKDFNQTLPTNLTYTMKTDATLANNELKATSSLNTSLANITLPNVTYDLKNLTLKTDYALSIDDLSKLNTIAKKDLKGKIVLNGHVKQAKESLMVDGDSTIFGGKLEFKLENDIFKATLQKAQLSELLAMLVYPDFFTSTIAANIDYDLKNAKGTLKATSDDGRFKQNQLGALLLAVTGLDITNEIYKNIIFDANIIKELITFKANMVSQNTQIKTEDGRINQMTHDISSQIDIKIKENHYTAKVSGKIDNPKVKMDSKALLRGLLGGGTNDSNTTTQQAPIQNLLKGLKF
ncbi:MAG: hypothetical protein PHN18_09835 [Sulfurospirillaceae bacterium]|nr:hypothetical protein [Sulfurospirillaceae bacterium]MDD2827055.1 hypothetical protein [Sulfurospirillaceae bacterium]